MQSVGRSTTTTVNVNTNAKKCDIRSQQSVSQWRLLNNARSYFLSRTSNLIDDEEFYVLSDLFECKNTCLPYEDYSTFNLNEMSERTNERVSVRV